MHRWIIACLVFVLIAQGAGVEGQTTSNGLDCTPEIDYTVAPSVVENNEAFHLVVIGDSIAWGAGLEKGKKYSFLVAEWLSKQLKRPVDVRILAHTGATIGKISEAPVKLPDLSGENPTLMEQTDSIPNPKHVDMILVSGGINDVTIDEIIKLDHIERSMTDYLSTGVGEPAATDAAMIWKGFCTEAELRQKTGKIEPLMLDLLTKLLSNCPSATIIVTGYFPIISEKSTGLTETIGTLMPESQYVPDYKKLDDDPHREQLRKKSDAFYDESTKSLDAAVQETGSKRVAFARIEFKPENCYGAGDSFLWRIKSGQTDDPLYKCRAALVGNKNGDEDLRDKVAAVGHPNEKGSNLYFSAIKEAIEKTAPEFLPKVENFSIASPTTRTIGESFEFDYIISDKGELGLKQVELWRKDESSDWQQIKTNALIGQTGPVSGSFMDSPSAPGKYWYGVHVVDNADNWNDQKNSNTNGQPSSFELVEVEVVGSALPTVLTFQVTPQSLNLGESFTINYTVSDVDGYGLKQVELWRKDESSDWQQIKANTYEGGIISVLIDMFKDSPSAPGKYLYGVHVVDIVGNWNDEKNSNTYGQPTSSEPVEVEVKSAQESVSNASIRTLKGHFDEVYSIAFSPDGSILAAGGNDGKVELWDVLSGSEIKTLEGHSKSVSSVAFSPDGNVLASGGSDGKIELWDVQAGIEIQMMECRSVKSVAFSPDGRMLASCGSSISPGSLNPDTTTLWDVSTGNEIRKLYGHSSGPTSVAFSPDGQTLAVGGDFSFFGGFIQLWDVSTGTEIQKVESDPRIVFSIAFSPDGRMLASGGFDGIVKLCDVSTGAKIRTLSGHSDWVRSVAFSPDGHILASGDDYPFGGRIKLWDVSTGTEIQTLKDNSDRVTSVAFSPDGHFLASGSRDGIIHLWGMDREITSSVTSGN